MSMTKKEQAAIQAAIDRADLLAALRWTAPVEPDVLPPERFEDRRTEGWTFNAHTGIVEKAWSGSNNHGTGSYEGRSYGSQGALPLFSTKERAHAAMRHALETQYAARLRAVDRAMRAEQ